LLSGRIMLNKCFKASLFLLMGLVLCSGCVTTKEGDLMKEDIIAGNAQIEQLEVNVSSNHKEISDKVDKINLEIGRLLQTSQTTTANDHAVLLRIDRDMRMLNGMVEKNGYEVQQTNIKFAETIAKLEKRIRILEAQLGVLPADDTKQKTGTTGATATGDDKTKTKEKPKESALPDNPSDFYKHAKSILTKEKNTVAGRRLMAVFLKRYPKNSLADNARYWTGESYYMEKNYHQAVMEFQKVVDQYKKGDAVDDALYMLGNSFLKLGMKEDAKLFYEECIERFPKSRSARKSKSALKKL